MAEADKPGAGPSGPIAMTDQRLRFGAETDRGTEPIAPLVTGGKAVRFAITAGADMDDFEALPQGLRPRAGPGRLKSRYELTVEASDGEGSVQAVVVIETVPGAASVPRDWSIIRRHLHAGRDVLLPPGVIEDEEIRTGPILAITGADPGFSGANEGRHVRVTLARPHGLAPQSNVEIAGSPADDGLYEVFTVIDATTISLWFPDGLNGRLTGAALRLVDPQWTDLSAPRGLAGVRAKIMSTFQRHDWAGNARADFGRVDPRQSVIRLRKGLQLSRGAADATLDGLGLHDLVLACPPAWKVDRSREGWLRRSTRGIDIQRCYIEGPFIDEPYQPVLPPAAFDQGNRAEHPNRWPHDAVKYKKFLYVDGERSSERLIKDCVVTGFLDPIVDWSGAESRKALEALPWTRAEGTVFIANRGDVVKIGAGAGHPWQGKVAIHDCVVLDQANLGNLHVDPMQTQHWGRNGAMAFFGVRPDGSDGANFINVGKGQGFGQMFIASVERERPTRDIRVGSNAFVSPSRNALRFGGGEEGVTLVGAASNIYARDAERARHGAYRYWEWHGNAYVMRELDVGLEEVDEHQGPQHQWGIYGNTISRIRMPYGVITAQNGNGAHEILSDAAFGVAGAWAHGRIDVTGTPAPGDTVRLGNRRRQILFEFVNRRGGGTIAGAEEVVIGVSPVDTAARLRDAIIRTADGELRWNTWFNPQTRIFIQNQNPGSEGNQPIEVTGNALEADGMSRGSDAYRTSDFSLIEHYEPVVLLGNDPESVFPALAQKKENARAVTPLDFSIDGAGTPYELWGRPAGPVGRGHDWQPILDRLHALGIQTPESYHIGDPDPDFYPEMTGLPRRADVDLPRNNDLTLALALRTPTAFGEVEILSMAGDGVVVEENADGTYTLSVREARGGDVVAAFTTPVLEPGAAYNLAIQVRLARDSSDFAYGLIGGFWGGVSRFEEMLAVGATATGGDIRYSGGGRASGVVFGSAGWGGALRGVLLHQSTEYRIKHVIDCVPRFINMDGVPPWWGTGGEAVRRDLRRRGVSEGPVALCYIDGVLKVAGRTVETVPV